MKSKMIITDRSIVFRRPCGIECRSNGVITFRTRSRFGCNYTCFKRDDIFYYLWSDGMIDEAIFRLRKKR